MKLPPDLEREIEAQIEGRGSPIERHAYRTGARFGASLMLKKILAELRSEEARHFEGNLPLHCEWADWLSERFKEKERSDE